MANRLAQETSPYLRQHRDNPVDWYPWGDAAFAEARRLNRPVLLSVGYAACHWCHVMAHESFEDPETAARMNRDFINIKLDREERPDLDHIYQSALALLGQQGGWPLTMFLTPDREPFWGGTYFPPEPRWGRPSFRQVLDAISDVFANDPARVANNRDTLQAALRNMNTARPGDLPGKDYFPALAAGLASLFDPIHGGTQGAPKFPQAPLLSLSWPLARTVKHEALTDHVLRSLRHMAQGGIYDHLAGGFARYSVDEFWLVPHFEKMLYDNAQLIELLSQAWMATGDELYRNRVFQTWEWLTSEMMIGEGFAAALDADSEGEEGKYYVWSKAEIAALLTPDDAADFCAAYDVTETGNWEGKNIPNRLHAVENGDDPALAASRQILLNARRRRIAPGRDDKILIDWNGMLIAALAEAGGIFDDPRLIAQAEATFHHLNRIARRGRRWYHSVCDGQPGPDGLLDDYAQMARAALFLHGATGKQLYLDHAIADMAIAQELFADAAQGGYFQSPIDQQDAPLRAKPFHDGPAPAGQAVMTECLVRLYFLTGAPSYRDAAEAVLKAHAELLTRAGPSVAGLGRALLLLTQAPTIFICTLDAATDPLSRSARTRGQSGQIIGYVAPGADLTPGHAAFGKNQQPGQAFVCRNMTCSLPLPDPEQLKRVLDA